MSPDTESWLRLVHHGGLGRARLRQLLAAFGSPQAVLDASPAALRRVAGERGSIGDATSVQADDSVERARRWLGATTSHHVVTLGDSGYPAPLLGTADPPLLLYVDGDLDALRGPALAIVGSRQASAQGLANARAFARSMAERGWVIVSGLASGIDAAAHEGALAGGGSTVAVLGTGIDIVYPRTNAALARRIVEHGALASEYPLTTPPLPANFPPRNRIIAALTRGTLVVEATMKSGSLITARLAGEAGREVFAIPGSIHSPQSRGCHALLRQGAKLVETVDDLTEELGEAATVLASASAANNDLDSERSHPDPVLRALGHDPATLDSLIARCGWGAAELNARLLELELEGRVARLPGGLFQRVAQG